MVGSQALVAFRDQNKGVVMAKTYDIRSYALVVPGKLSFDVWDLTAEEVMSGELRIFAKVKVPENAVRVNQVWQVGPAVMDDGRIVAHSMAPANMRSRGVLNLKSSGQSFVSNDGDDTKAHQKNVNERKLHYYGFLI